jgi:NTP pyrophosphatase (non-canonical NTP hydrolase)
MDIRELQRMSYDTAKAHGFWDDVEAGRPIGEAVGEKLMLIVTEVAEVMEAYRERGHAPGGIVWYRDEDGKPEGMAAELADTIIRIADLAEMLGIDLDAALREKMSFNLSRPYKHGKVC